jgi:hypothetical protein
MGESTCSTQIDAHLRYKQFDMGNSHIPPD